MPNHWSQLVSDDNPRGYSEKQMQRIADAGPLLKKRSVELEVMRRRQESDMKMKQPIDDEYGVDRINAMIADIQSEYAAKVDIDGARAVDEEEDGDISEGF
jgi:hypothetical protein